MLSFVPNDSNSTQEVILLASSHSETYCSDLSCSCHTDVQYHAEVTGIQEYSQEEVRKAFRAFGIRQ